MEISIHFPAIFHTFSIYFPSIFHLFSQRNLPICPELQARMPFRANLKKTKVKSNEARPPHARLRPVAASWGSLLGTPKGRKSGDLQLWKTIGKPLENDGLMGF